MDLSHPYKAVLPGTDGDVLRVLAGSTQPFSGRKVARLAEATHTTVQRSLDRLVEHGLVERVDAGRAALYTLNRNHLAANPVTALVTIRATLLKRLTDAVSGWPTKPNHVSLFGSAARADGDTESDIDLVVVRPAAVDGDDPEWRHQLDDLALKAHLWTGNHLSVLELSPSDLHALVRERPAIVDELRSDAVTLLGEDIRALLPPR